MPIAAFCILPFAASLPLSCLHSAIVLVLPGYNSHKDFHGMPACLTALSNYHIDDNTALFVSR